MRQRVLPARRRSSRRLVQACEGLQERCLILGSKLTTFIITRPTDRYGGRRQAAQCPSQTGLVKPASPVVRTSTGIFHSYIAVVIIAESTPMTRSRHFLAVRIRLRFGQCHLAEWTAGHHHHLVPFVPAPPADPKLNILSSTQCDTGSGHGQQTHRHEFALDHLGDLAHQFLHHCWWQWHHRSQIYWLKDRFRRRGFIVWSGSTPTT